MSELSELFASLYADKIERGDEGGCEGVKGDLVPLEYFNYTNQKLGCLIHESMDEIKFLGISVSIYIPYPRH